MSKNDEGAIVGIGGGAGTALQNGVAPIVAVSLNLSLGVEATLVLDWEEVGLTRSAVGVARETTEEEDRDAPSSGSGSAHRTPSVSSSGGRG